MTNSEVCPNIPLLLQNKVWFMSQYLRVLYLKKPTQTCLNNSRNRKQTTPKWVLPFQWTKEESLAWLLTSELFAAHNLPLSLAGLFNWYTRKSASHYYHVTFFSLNLLSHALRIFCPPQPTLGKNMQFFFGHSQLGNYTSSILLGPSESCACLTDLFASLFTGLLF